MKPKTVGRVTEGLNSPAYAQFQCHGFPVGAKIMTADGDLPVEYLSPGDRVVTRNGGMTKLLEIQATTQHTRAIAFSRGGLDSNIPSENMLLPADQPILLRGTMALAASGQNQVMVAAQDLVDDVNIRDMGPRQMVLMRLAFDRPRIVYSNGFELSTAPLKAMQFRAVA